MPQCIPTQHNNKGKNPCWNVFETETYDVVSIYIGMWKCEGLQSTQCDHLETKLPGEENIIIFKLDRPIGHCC
jgi:hypothetical protein